MSHNHFLVLCPPPPISTLFPYTTLFRSGRVDDRRHVVGGDRVESPLAEIGRAGRAAGARLVQRDRAVGLALHERSEEHTSELQSHVNLVCRLLLEKKKYTTSCRS